MKYFMIDYTACNLAFLESWSPKVFAFEEATVITLCIYTQVILHVLHVCLLCSEAKYIKKVGNKLEM